MSRSARRIAAVLIGASPLLAAYACDGPLVPEVPVPEVAAYSASPFAIDVGFDRPLDRTSASQAVHYAITRAPGDRVSPVSAALEDTLFGQTVRLLFRLGTFQDSTLYSITVMGLRDAWGQPLSAEDSTVVQFRTGLWYSPPIQQILDRKCTPCHNAERQGGSYRTDSYDALFGFGTDAGSSNPRPNVVPGDARSLLVIRTSPLHSMFNVAHLSYLESQLITNWVVTYQARR